MEILFSILMFFSTPLFYIVGIIVIVKLFSNNQNGPKTRQHLLKQIIEEITRKKQAQPRISVSKLIESFQQEHDTLTTQQQHQTTQTVQAKINPETPAKPVAPTPSLANWHSDNSVNFLLYIGAFLIVASAFTFVRFQWEAIDGMTKGLLITIMMSGFLISGLRFYQIPKIRQAAVTFSTIGALLIPFCGWAWHAFYLADIGVNGSTVWFITSLMSAGVYTALTLYLHNQTFSYLTHMTVFSTVASLVSVNSLPGGYYAVSASVSALILQIIRFVWLKNKTAKPLFDTSTVQVADTLATLSLGYGLVMATMVGNIFTIESVLLVIVSMLYFLSSYAQFNTPIYLLGLDITIPLFIFVFFGWNNTVSEATYYALTLIILSYIGIAFANRQNTTAKHNSVHLGVGMILANILLLASIIQGLDVADISKLSFTPIIVGLAITYLNKQLGFLILSALYTLIFCYYALVNTIGLPVIPYLHLTYLMLGISVYGLVYYAKPGTSVVKYLACIVGVFFLGNWLISLGHNLYMLLTVATLGAIFTITALRFSKFRYIYASNLMITYALILFARHINLTTMMYPLLLLILFGLMNVLAHTAWQSARPMYRKSALIGLLLTPLVYMNSAEPSALVAGYGAIILISIDAYLTHNTNRAYLASAIGIIVYLWQIQYLGVTQSQLYSLPLALYFLTLGWLQAKQHHIEKRDFLYLISLVFIIVPTSSQAFAMDGAGYALLLGSYGIGLIALGNTIVYSRFRLGGSIAIIIAVFSQLYEYALSLPRWIIIGSVGMTLLSIALIILIKRKNE